MPVEFERLGLWNWERADVESEVRAARHAEAAGFTTVWQGESRLVRDAKTILGAYTRETDRIGLGTGVTNCYTRNVALMAQTAATLDELSAGRFRLGIGAWWDPLADRVGIDRDRPLRRLYEYCTVVDRLLDLEPVTYEGETLSVDGISIDRVRTDAPAPDVPIYVGATGPTANEMTGELVGEGVADGALLNYLVPPEHTEASVSKLREGVEKQGGELTDVDRPGIVAVSMAADHDAAVDAARGLVAQYVGQQPHIREWSGIDEALAAEIEDELGGWPADEADVERAAEYVPDDVVRNVVAAGTPEECVERVGEYVAAGCTEPVLYPIRDNVRGVINTFAARTAAEE